MGQKGACSDCGARTENMRRACTSVLDAMERAFAKIARNRLIYPESVSLNALKGRLKALNGRLTALKVPLKVLNGA